MKPIDFTHLFQKYSGKWVALADDEKTVLGSSKSAQRALAEAQKTGFKNPILFKVPQSSLAYVGGVRA